jgi:hypothetical protein
MDDKSDTLFNTIFTTLGVVVLLVSGLGWWLFITGPETKGPYKNLRFSYEVEHSGYILNVLAEYEVHVYPQQQRVTILMLSPERGASYVDMRLTEMLAPPKRSPLTNPTQAINQLRSTLNNSDIKELTECTIHSADTWSCRGQLPTVYDYDVGGKLGQSESRLADQLVSSMRQQNEIGMVGGEWTLHKPSLLTRNLDWLLAQWQCRDICFVEKFEDRETRIEQTARQLRDVMSVLEKPES